MSRQGLFGQLFPPQQRKCDSCQWRNDATPFYDADGRRFFMCDECRPAAEAEKARTLDARRRAKDAREREALGQLRLDGTGPAHPIRPKQEGMGL